jgi:hypothetical protein
MQRSEMIFFRFVGKSAAKVRAQKVFLLASSNLCPHGKEAEFFEKQRIYLFFKRVFCDGEIGLKCQKVFSSQAWAGTTGTDAGCGGLFERKKTLRINRVFDAGHERGLHGRRYC